MSRTRGNPKDLKVSPLVREFFEILNGDEITYEQLGVLAGVAPETIVRWRRTTAPNLATFSACLETLGYSLEIKKIEK
jgi:hypothetical protein